MGSVAVRQEEQIIHATYWGEMTIDIVREGQRQIEALVGRIDGPRILYDTLAMEPPTMKLAMEMKAFDGRIRSRVVRSATVVKDGPTAFMAKVAFALSREHKVFYDDLAPAYEWLKAG